MVLGLRALGGVIAGVALWAFPAGAAAAFPGENGRIVYESSADGGTDIWSLREDLSRTRNLTERHSGFNGGPTVSPDGTRIAFESDRSGNPDIFVMRANGNQPVNLTAGSAVSDFEPAFSPDGEWIAFVRRNGLAGDADVWIMDAEGGNQQLLYAGPGGTDERAPVFSVDGRIAFLSAPDAVTGSELYVMDGDGSDVESVPVGADGIVGPADFSPDGEDILFSWWNGDFRDPVEEIRLFDGVSERTLASGWDGSFSPDGHGVVFGATGGFGELRLLDLGSGAVSGAGVEGRNPVWAPRRAPRWRQVAVR